MFSRIRTERYTDGCSQAERLRAALDGADAVVIGAGSGLSTAAGFTYAGGILGLLEQVYPRQPVPGRAGASV